MTYPPKGSESLEKVEMRLVPLRLPGSNKDFSAFKSFLAQSNKIVAIGMLKI